MHLGWALRARWHQRPTKLRSDGGSGTISSGHRLTPHPGYANIGMYQRMKDFTPVADICRPRRIDPPGRRSVEQCRSTRRIADSGAFFGDPLPPSRSAFPTPPRGCRLGRQECGMNRRQLLRSAAALPAAGAAFSAAAAAQSNRGAERMAGGLLYRSAKMPCNRRSQQLSRAAGGSLPHRGRTLGGSMPRRESLR